MIEYSFTKHAINAMKRHAGKEYPKEACGFIVDGKYVRVPNSAEEPEGDFRIDPKEYIKAEKKGKIECIVHSHRYENPYPSHMDQVAQIKSGLPWGLVVCRETRHCDVWFWGDQLPRQPILGRPFVYGIYDCYTLARDWYLQEYGVDIPFYPSKWLWWKDPEHENLFQKGFKEAGFYQVDRENLKYGDGLFGSIRGSDPNHCGIYIGNGLILHHLPDRLSRREPMGPWFKNISHILRNREVEKLQNDA